MGVLVAVEDAQGNRLGEVNDPKGFISKVLPDVNCTSFAALRFIDEYGDTVFNSIQTKVFLQERSRIRAKATTCYELDIFKRVADLAKQAKSPHLFLRFYGD